ncbi:MAG TPA: aldehyde dehydrogenase family protein [Vicinamibacterales bacterium]|jgi:acetaldehyde dehydrogenase (acetylating)|nr:aldehyde dehydrogenase family protein [Vicinamibacterales bacterium]
MAQAQGQAQTDRDLASIAEARSLARRAKDAAPILAEFSQEQIDAIVDAMAAAATQHAEALARLACEETGYGVVEDKIQKNLFASEKVYRFIRPMKTVGVVNRLEDRKVIEIADPFGVVCAIVPTTNPTSTAIYKILIAIKARCPIVISPHPSAVRCIARSAEIMTDAARRAGAPDGAISCMTTVTLEGTQELMKAKETAVILATGGLGLVRAAYSAGKPAYGVGPGNAPCYVERTADVPKAVSDIVIGKTFDNGVLCSSPNSVVVDAPILEAVKREFVMNGGYFLSPAEADRLAKVLLGPNRLPVPALVGRPATTIAQAAGLSVPADTRVLIAELKGVGRDYPLSIEKLSPVLSFYAVADWREGCERCKEILRYGGMGHTMSIHSRDDRIILEFGLKKPAYRICVNTPTTHGSIGLTTGLDPSMTLGCGGWGGNITSDNISPRHLINIKRLAYETEPAKRPSAMSAPKDMTRSAVEAFVKGALPRPPAGPPAPGGIAADVLARKIDEFLSSRGYAPRASAGGADREKGAEGAGRAEGADGARADSALPAFSAATPPAPPARSAPSAPPPPPPAPVADFVCEDDVRQALKQNRKIVIGEKTIVTPAARDLGEQHRAFVQADWRG